VVGQLLHVGVGLHTAAAVGEVRYDLPVRRAVGVHRLGAVGPGVLVGDVGVVSVRHRDGGGGGVGAAVGAERHHTRPGPRCLGRGGGGGGGWGDGLRHRRCRRSGHSLGGGHGLRRRVRHHTGHGDLRPARDLGDSRVGGAGRGGGDDRRPGIRAAQDERDHREEDEGDTSVHGQPFLPSPPPSVQQKSLGSRERLPQSVAAAVNVEDHKPGTSVPEADAVCVTVSAASASANALSVISRVERACPSPLARTTRTPVRAPYSAQGPRRPIHSPSTSLADVRRSSIARIDDRSTRPDGHPLAQSAVWRGVELTGTPRARSPPACVCLARPRLVRGGANAPSVDIGPRGATGSPDACYARRPGRRGSDLAHLTGRPLMPPSVSYSCR